MQQMTPTKVSLKHVSEPIGISESESSVTRNSISIKAKSLEILISLCNKSNKIPVSHKQKPALQQTRLIRFQSFLDIHAEDFS